jgi:DNA topoisomerase-3
MQALVTHFGDRDGAKRPCGLCDFCAPEDCEAQVVRSANDEEVHIAHAALAALKERDGISSGNLHTSVCGRLPMKMAPDRDRFERLLDFLAAAGWIEIRDASFTADDREVRYRKVLLTREGRATEEDTDLGLVIREQVERTEKGRAKRAKTATKDGRRAAKAGRTNGATPASRGGKRSARAGEAESELEAEMAAQASHPALEEALKAWRLAEAKRKRVPAFRICSDKTIHTLAEQQPQSLNELLQVPGIGLKMAEKYGATLLRILAGK